MLVRPARHEYRTFSQDSRYWAGYRPRAGDIIVATSPKCGTTWMQQILCLLIFQDPKPRSLPAVSPWVEARFRSTTEQMRLQLEGQTHRCFLKTHLPIDGLLLYDEVKYIYVARDGRDAVLSMHNHFTGFSEAQIALFDRIGREDSAIACDYPRPLTDPIVDLDGEMRAIADFLDTEVDDAVVVSGASGRLRSHEGSRGRTDASDPEHVRGRSQPLLPQGRIRRLEGRSYGQRCLRLRGQGQDRADAGPHRLVAGWSSQRWRPAHLIGVSSDTSVVAEGPSAQGPERRPLA